MTVFVQSVLDGLSAGALFSMLALGLTMSFGIARIVNFAHGAFMAFGGLVAASVAARVGASLGAYILAAIVGIFATGALALGAERSVFRRAKADAATALVVSLGLILVLNNLTTRLWGSDGKGIKPVIQGSVQFAGLHITQAALVRLVLVAVMLIIYFTVLRFTPIGAVWRAMSQDADAAELLGLRVGLHRSLNFVIGTALAGLAGALVLLTTTVTPLTGAPYIAIAFAAVIAGGLGHPMGAVLAGLLIGLAQSFTGTYGNPAYVNAVAMIVLVVVLIVRPQGLWASDDQTW